MNESGEEEVGGSEADMRSIGSAVLALGGGVMAAGGAVGEGIALTGGAYSQTSEMIAWVGVAIAAIGTEAFGIDCFRTWRGGPRNP